MKEYPTQRRVGTQCIAYPQETKAATAVRARCSFLNTMVAWQLEAQTRLHGLPRS